MKETSADYRGFTFLSNLVISNLIVPLLKAIYYISNFSKDLSKHDIDKLIQTVNKKNKLLNVTGLLIIKNKHFFQILEGEDEKIDPLYEKIKMTLDIQVLLDC